MFRFNTIFFISILIYYSSSEDTNTYKIVETNNGKIRGLLQKTLIDDISYYSFRGIPYAKPPVGDLRFKATVKTDNWIGIKDALEFGNVCVQTSYHYPMEAEGDENCLFLNIFAPGNNLKYYVYYVHIVGEDTGSRIIGLFPNTLQESSEKLPVMVFIHGGGFQTGSSNPYGPDFLIENNVVVVSLNYRLGPFGFLSLGTQEYSGNMGLKDQAMALKWIKDNIKYFNGDDQKITILGESAGGASTQYHLISPSSRGLFQRAIPISGASFCLWAFRKDNHLDMVKEYALKDGYTISNTEDVLSYLSAVDAKHLSKYSFRDIIPPYQTTATALNLTYVPTVEDENSINPFLTDTPKNLIQSNSMQNVDIMFGYTSNELLFYIAKEIKNPKLIEVLNDKFEIQLPLWSNENVDYDSKIYKEIAKDIRNYYFPENVRIDKDTLGEFSNVISDVGLAYCVEKSFELQQKKTNGKAFLYKFSVETNLNEFRRQSGVFSLEKNIEGSSHADDIFHIYKIIDSLFGEPFNEVYQNLSEKEISAIRYVSGLWANFAKYGNPTPDVVVKDNEIHTLHITNDGVKHDVTLLESAKFWDALYKKYKHFLSEKRSQDEL